MHEHHIQDDTGRWHCFCHLRLDNLFTWLWCEEHKPGVLTTVVHSGV